MGETLTGNTGQVQLGLITTVGIYSQSQPVETGALREKVSAAAVLIVVCWGFFVCFHWS